MTEITTLTQFLTTANTQFQVYDMGRRVQHIDMLAFQQIENLASSYPSPIQGHAQFAIVFWDASQQHYIWFLKLPLDERGLLSPAPRTQFIRMIIEALGRDPSQALSKEQQQKLANHPFSFKPTSEKLALFNALVKKQLGQVASPQYEFAYQYLSKQLKAEHWQEVGLQGLADICVRANELDHLNVLIDSFDFAATEVQVAVCQCLEHLEIDEQLADTVLEKLKLADNELKPYYLRALASDEQSSIDGIAHLAELNLLDANVLITIAARNWLALKETQTRKIFLEALAKQEQHFFNQIFADIVAIPALRTQLLSELRNPDRSEVLSAAIGGLFKVTKA
ncbi:DUF3549 family protein [Shewanella woodyi]|uniref:DUF3549 domain-containing protein n=1 Tax=Shewanella woodyi (strain ATCC 51908 / MS32) TaxID=392500 RepID=B1KNV3_SHEWM|nr:DUF3549 family protein [Shewanella woodyi]ACA87561.1 conserved hypothetical protein [Shewanella woodyi ATCC 51908]